MAITPRLAYAAPARGSAARTLRNAVSAASSSPRRRAASPSAKIFWRSATAGLLVAAVRVCDTAERKNMPAEQTAGRPPANVNAKKFAARASTRALRFITVVVSSRPRRNSSDRVEIPPCQPDSARPGAEECELCPTPLKRTGPKIKQTKSPLTPTRLCLINSI
jgi:hypothetical protein